MTTIADSMKRNSFAAPTLDAFRPISRNECWNVSTNKEKEAMDVLMEEFTKIQPYNDDGCYELWFSLPRGTIEDFGDYEEYRQWGDVASRQEFEELWKEYYPEEPKWYHMVGVFRDGYQGILINGRMWIEYNPHRNEQFDSDIYEDSNCYLLTHLTTKVKECLKQLEDGVYNLNINNHISYTMRTGTILRKHYWEVYPDDKERVFEGMCDENYEEFKKMIEGNQVEMPEGRMLNMSANAFFHACYLGYKECGYKLDGLYPVQAYTRYADGRDDGLREIDPDSFTEFESWFRGDTKQFSGGHPWEVCRGGNSTHIDLYVDHDEKGWYFMVAGKAWTRSVEAVNFFLAIHRAGYPVGLYDAKRIADRFSGEAKMGIVPSGVTPSYCESWFPNEDVFDFMNLYDDEYENLKEFIQWYPLADVNYPAQFNRIGRGLSHCGKPD